MPCYRCDTRQTDPARGPSLWKRGVVGGELVLVCPACQQVHDWTADLDRCTACGSSSLVRQLGATACRACGHEGDGVVASTPGAPVARAPAEGDRVATRGGLADDVAAALRRVLGEQAD